MIVYISFVCRRMSNIVSLQDFQYTGLLEMSEQDLTHQAISAYFIGPKAENLNLFQENIKTILDELKDARLKYFPEDGVSAFHS